MTQREPFEDLQTMSEAEFFQELRYYLKYSSDHSMIFHRSEVRGFVLRLLTMLEESDTLAREFVGVEGPLPTISLMVLQRITERASHVRDIK